VDGTMLESEIYKLKDFIIGNYRTCLLVQLKTWRLLHVTKQWEECILHSNQGGTAERMLFRPDIVGREGFFYW